MKVEVRDTINPDRLLGHVVDPPSMRERVVRFAVAPRFDFLAAPDKVPEIVNVKYVTFDTLHYYEDRGYTRRTKFVTNAPLEELLLMSNFRLPGESDEAARERLWRSM